MEETVIDETAEAVMDEAAIEKLVEVFGIASKIVGCVMIGVGSILVYKGLTGK